MDNKQAISGRFAHLLVGAMLQRSGVEFFEAPAGSDRGVDFLVRQGETQIPIEVKYADDAQKAQALWAHHSCAKSSVQPIHLVIVADNGRAVFTDAAAAAVLEPDARTTMTVLGEESVS